MHVILKSKATHVFFPILRPLFLNFKNVFQKEKDSDFKNLNNILNMIYFYPQTTYTRAFNPHLTEHIIIKGFLLSLFVVHYLFGRLKFWSEQLNLCSCERVLKVVMNNWQEWSKYFNIYWWTSLTVTFGLGKTLSSTLNDLKIAFQTTPNVLCLISFTAIYCDTRPL